MIDTLGKSSGYEINFLAWNFNLAHEELRHNKIKYPLLAIILLRKNYFVLPPTHSYLHSMILIHDMMSSPTFIFKLRLM